MKSIALWEKQNKIELQCSIQECGSIDSFSLFFAYYGEPAKGKIYVNQIL